MIGHASVTLTAKNRLCNEDGLQHVIDLNVCKKAAVILHDQYSSVKFEGDNRGKYPPGCFLFVYHKHAFIYFNSGSGHRNANSQHICKEGSYIEK